MWMKRTGTRRRCDMTDVVKREARTPDAVDLFDRFIDNWSGFWPMRRPWWLGFEAPRDEMIRVEEFRDGDTLVVRAELPGIDPDKDVEVTAADGMLHLHAERREEHKEDEGGVHRRELRYGSFSRTLALPPGAKEDDIVATYNDGMLEVRVPTPKSSATKVPVNKG
jgi:HSP20 family protein